MRAKKLFPATADLSNTDRHINSMLELGARSPPDRAAGHGSLGLHQARPHARN